jgi:soluble lytic murein transglycosylase-like protein
MQLMPQTARSHGVIDPFDPKDNARGATRFLHELWTHYGGDRRRVAAAYNAGSGRVPRGRGEMRVPASTLGYAARVMRHDRKTSAQALRQPILLTTR